ncbi:MAG: ATP-binding protein [Candidatus Firestonebacteria bacterium]
MKLKESETLELKKSTSEINEAVISIVSILNKHQKGELYFGIKDDGKVVGQQIGKDTERDISRAIFHNIEPKIHPAISKIKIDGKTCIKVDFKSRKTMYYAFGRPYIRIGVENRKLGPEEQEEFILRKNSEKLRWDTDIYPKAKLIDISFAKVKTYLKTSGLKYDSLHNALVKLKLILDDKLVNAGIMLFGKKPQNFFPNAKLRCAVFATMDTVTPVDMKDFEGDVFYLIKEAEKYILENIHIGMRLEGLRRVDVPEIDKEAFREAIINAFCHRDYFEWDSVNIAVFKDRLEIRSPGLLYGGLTIEKIKKENVSQRRNELIAELLHRVHFIEKWGRGISLILSKEPTANFKEIGMQFVTVFKRKNIVKQKLQKTTQKTPRKHPENTQKIIDAILKNPYVTRQELAKTMKTTEDSIKHHLKTLSKKGVLKRVGPDKGGSWEIIQG